MNPFIQFKNATPLIVIAFMNVCPALLPKSQAVSPAPDGGYSGGNTAEGESALLSLTTGGFNTAIGFLSLKSDTTNRFNTAIGAGTLVANTADENTATGAGALLSNTTGFNNTANGAFALSSNTTGRSNTANGDRALGSNTIGDANTATGAAALDSNTTGATNTATGRHALFNNTTGSGNTALGDGAGANQTTGNNNVYIGAGMGGVTGESHACYIASIFGQTIDPTTGTAVGVDTNGKLGTMLSARRFKHDIKPMDSASEAILALKPVIFHYKSDAKNTPCFGLVAEEVADVNPNLVVRDKNGEILTVRYEAVNAMLLNEFLKEHKAFVQEQHKVEKLEATVANLLRTVKEQAAQIQKVSAQLELTKPATETVLNNH